MSTTLVEIAPLKVAHVPEVMPIERASYVAPWSMAMFVLELSRPETLSVAARIGGTMVGYLVCSPQGHEWHVMNVTVDPAHRREGIARRLLDAVHERLDTATGGNPRTTLEVRPSNEPALELYFSLGYLVAGRRKAYYPDNGEDALVMWRTPSTRRGTLEGIPAIDAAEARRWNDR